MSANGNSTKILGQKVTGTTGTQSSNLVYSDSPALITPDLGTPSALVATNVTGTASGLTAGTIENAAYKQFPCSGKVILIGDSLAANGASSTSAGGSTLYTTSAHQRGFMNWFQTLYNYPYDHKFKFFGGALAQGNNKGISGDDTLDVIPRIKQQVLNQNPAIVYLHIGTNDINAGGTTANIMSNIYEIIEQCVDANAKVWVNCIFPRNNSGGSGFTAPEEAIRLAVNSAILDLPSRYPGSVLAISCDSFFLDPGTGELYTKYSYDGVHLNSLGAVTFAELGIAAQAWSKISSSQGLSRFIPSDYNASTVPYGNLLTNGSAFTGTSGTAGTGVTGTVVTSFLVERSAGSTITGVASVSSGTNWNGDTVNFQNIDISAIGTGTDSETMRMRTSTATISSGVSIGNWVVAEIEVIISTTGSGTNPIRSIYLEPRDNGTGGDCMRAFGNRFTSGSDKDYLPDDVQRHLILRTAPFQIKTTTGMLYRMNIDVDGTLTGTRSISVTQPVLKLVPFGVQEKAAVFKCSYTSVVAGGVFILPENSVLDEIIVFNTTANAVTGGLKFGKTSGASDIVAALAVGANEATYVADASMLLRYFSPTARQTIYFDAVTAWNSANLNITFTWKELG